ncbi:MAG: ABC transporter substrate-binding protein [Chloroflexota bacterium]
MNIKRILTLLAALLLLLFVLVACGSPTAPEEAAAPTEAPVVEEPTDEPEPEPEPTEEEMEEEAEEEMEEEEMAEEEMEEEEMEEEEMAEEMDEEMTEFVFAHPGPIRTMDAPVTWFGSTHWLTNTLYDCLIWRNADGSGFHGQAAESWEAVDDITWRFNLRPGITFQNGEPLDAEAVKWNLDRVQTREDFLVHPQWQFMSEVNVIDETTIEVVTDGPNSSLEFFISFNGCQILPPDYLEEVGEEEFARNPIGSGPYKLVEFTESDRYVFEAWDDYHGGRPEVDRIIYQVIPEAGSQVAALLAGQVDFITNVPVPDFDRVSSADGIGILAAPGGRQHLLEVRSDSSAGDMQETYDGYVATTENKLIRQAINRALDRELLADVQGGARPLLLRTDDWYPEHRGQYAGTQAAIDYYDPELAKELIIEAGFDPDNGDRPKIFMDSMAFQVGNEKEVAEVAAALLEEVGFDVELTVLETAAYSEQVSQPGNNRELLMQVIGSSPYLTPVFYNCDWVEVNDNICDIVEGDWQDTGVAIQQTVDFDARMELWETFWDFYVDEALEITLYHTNRNMAINSDEFEWTPRKDGWFTFRDLKPVDN